MQYVSCPVCGEKFWVWWSVGSAIPWIHLDTHPVWDVIWARERRMERNEAKNQGEKYPAEAPARG